MPELKRNSNHPRKGSSIKVEPIRNRSDIDRIKELLAPCPRNYALFTFGINTALRVNELVKLTVGQVAYLKVGDTLTLKLSKQNKHRPITINKNAYDAIQKCLSVHPNRNDDRSPLFFSKTSRNALKTQTVSKYIKGWCATIGIGGNYSSHTMRKTFGFHVYRNSRPKIAELMTVYRHKTERQTLEYLCIQDEEIAELYTDNPL